MASDRRHDMKKLLGLPVIYLALFLSGGAALVYQATWGRMLHRVFGVSDQAIATVLAAFFLGLGIGAALGGRWGRRLRRPALTYAALEAGIGAFALLSLLLIPRIHDLYAALGANASGVTLTLVRLTFALLLLLPPTILMGATLPVLIALLAPQRATWSTSATWLYATNTVGAMVGAGLTGLYFVPHFGARASIVIAAVASLGGAALVAAVWRREPSGDPTPPSAPAEPSGAVKPHALRLAMWIAGVAGMAALASEVLWTRVLRMVLVGTTQSFSAMLVNYLAGIALGSLLAAELMRRGHRASVLLGLSQVLLGVLTVVAMGIAPQLPRLIALIHGSANLIPHELSVIVIVSALLLFPIALALGTSIPLCWRLAQSTPQEAPQHAGRVLAANTLGGLVGSLLAGFGAVPLVGLEVSILVVMFVHLALGGIVLQTAVGDDLIRRVAAVAAPLAIGMLLLSRGPTLHLAFLLGAPARPRDAVLQGPDETWWAPVAYLEEGRNTTVTVIETPGKFTLYNDGRPESQFLDSEPGIGVEQVLLGGLPNLYVEPRERALVIGLGAGHTATMLLTAPWKDVHVVELEGAVVNAARFMHEARQRPFPIDDARARLTVDDARAQLVLAGEGTLDAVVSQPSHPWLAGSSALYTEEFFREVRRALRPTGVLSLWVNLFRIETHHVASVLATLSSVFPNIHGFVVNNNLILIASASPLVLGQRAQERYREIGLDRYLKTLRGHGLAALVATREIDSAGIAALALDVEHIVDDRPALEFELARLPTSQRIGHGELDVLFRDVPWISPEAFAAVPGDERANVLLTRLDTSAARPTAVARLERAMIELDLSPDERALLSGGIALSRGDVDEALRRYDSAATPRAATRADQLRVYMLRFGELLARSRHRTVAPSDPSALISAALALGDPASLTHALEVANETPSQDQRGAFAVLASMRRDGCEGVLALTAGVLSGCDDEYALLLAEHCALQIHDLAKATWLGNERARVRAQLALDAAGEGVEHLTFGNVPGAILHLHHALAKDPTQGAAAATLANLLMSTGRREEAERVLNRAFYATRGLPSAAEIAESARLLHVELPN